MSEQGWRDVLAADGLEDWVILHGGPTAVMQAAVAAGGTIVEDSGAPGAWILADRSGNKVCIAAWPDGAPVPETADDSA